MSKLDLDLDLESYDYSLPERLIAQMPAEPRDSSRLLVLHRKEQRWEHRRFLDLPEYLSPDDQIVVNNSQVLKARLLGHRLKLDGDRWVLGGRVEFLLLEELEPRVWEGLFRASARSQPGLQFEIPTPDKKGLRGKVVRGSSDSSTGTVVVEFDRDPVEAKAGELPLPHYITRAPQTQDEIQYQTIYAQRLGSAAAPTAGLHFTERMRQQLKASGVQWEEVTLHVGIGTFRPVKERDIRLHAMHEERYEISVQAAQSITDWKAQGKKVLAVGTTGVRTLESAWKAGPQRIVGIQSGIGRTSLFIRPGAFEFKVVDKLLTNFHIPRSSLLMLVCAFAGRELTLAAYQDAIEKNYRLLSYGDAMLIL